MAVTSARMLLVVPQWRAGGLNALDVARLARVAEAPLLRSAVRALAAELGLDPEATVEPLCTGTTPSASA
ncbi:hypothetical protein GCM10027452_01830 [Micromonospora halotolerans]